MKGVKPLEHEEGAEFVEIAKYQDEYLTLPAYRKDGVVMTEWELTETERLAIAQGGRVRMWTHTFGRPFQPTSMNAVPAREVIPDVVCLCGSTKFIEQFDEHSLRFTLAGKIVLSVGSHYPVSRQYADGKDGAKAGLDELHKRKIDMANLVFVLNVGGYIGDSTRSEIEYAEAHGKTIEYLEPVDADEQPTP